MSAGVLALDQGSHASRACVFDAHGVLRAEHSVAVNTGHAAGERVEQDPLELLASLRSVACAALAQCPGLEVRQAGLVTQRSTVLCWNRGTGAPLSAALSWQDRRNAAWLETFAAHAARVRVLTGLPLSPHYGVSKLRWCLDHLPQVRDAARAHALQAGPLVAWLQAQLCGAPARVDPANASRTLLYDSAKAGWSAELLQLFGVPGNVLPACSATRGDFGALADIRDASNHTIELCALSGDQSAVPFGLGPVSERTLYINLGTGAFLQLPTRHRPASPAPLLGSVLYADAERTLYTLEGTVNGAGSAVSAYCAQHQLDEAQSWPQLERLPEDAALPVYLNTVGGLGSPWWTGAVAPQMLGAGTALEGFAAVVESVVFLIAANAGELRRKGAAMDRVLLSGGLSRSDLLCRRLATLLGVPVERAEREASARGVAVLAAPEVAAHWPALATTRFEARRHAGLEQRFARFQEILHARLDAARGQPPRG